MKLLLCMFLMALALPSVAEHTTLVDEKDLGRYWTQESQSITQTPALARLNRARHEALKKFGEVFVTMDFTIQTDGSVRDVVVTKVEPAEAATKAYALNQALRKFKPAAGVEPTEVRVHVERRRNWIPNPSD